MEQSVALPPLEAVVAMAANRVIGRQGQLPWHLPEDLKFFKGLTSGHTILMGRKTYESIGRPLPKRRNIVLSRSDLTLPGVEVVHAVEDLAHLGLAGDLPTFVIGGAEIYRLLLPHCRAVWLSKVHRAYVGDALMLEFESEFRQEEKVADFADFTVWKYSR